jgi:TolB-like protein
MATPNGEETVPHGEVLRALARVLHSSAFAQSTRLSNFLRYAVEQTLNGQSESIKEYTIGTNAYGRRADFDPSQDTIVRTEARRLRRKLEEYYKDEGEKDEILIFFRSGSYVPVIRWRTSLAGRMDLAGRTTEALWVEGDGIYVAVTPFEAHVSDPAAFSFAFGVTEEVLHRLSRVPGVRVVSEARSIQSKPNGTEPAEDQKRQAVQITIDGVVRSEQKRIRVTARVTTAPGLVLWSQRFDAAMEQDALLELQETLAAALLNRVAPREAIIRRYAGTPTQTLYMFYAEALAAEALVEEGSIPSITTALAKFEALSVRAPEYARPYCGIAQSCVALAQSGVYPSEELVARATKACRKAIAIDSEVIEAHSTLGCALAQEWKWIAAEESFLAALRLGDQHSTHRQFAQFLSLHSRFDEAWKHLQIAQGMDPFSVRQKIAVSRFFYYSRWHKEAKEHYAKAAQQGISAVEPIYFRALQAIEMGEPEAAIAIAEGLRRQVAGVPSYMAAVVEIFASCKQHQQARSFLDRAGLLTKDAALSCFRKATLALALGDRAASLKFLEESFRRKEPDLPWLDVDPRFDGIREEKAFLAVHRKVFQK